MKIENEVSNIGEIREFLQLASEMHVPDDAALAIRRKRTTGGPWTFSVEWEPGKGGVA